MPYTATAASGIASVKLWYTTSHGSTWTQFGASFTSSPISFTSAGDGDYGFYVQATDNLGISNALPSGAGSVQAQTIVDTTPPSATASALPRYEANNTFNVPFIATDANGVAGVKLWYSLNNGSAWTQFGASFTSSPILFTATAGDGTYDFYLQGSDKAGNANAAPGGAASVQAATILDTTPPTAAASALPTYETNTAFNVAYTATDASGVTSVKLWYSTNNGSLWTQVGGSFASSPISFTATAGDGNYDFYIQAIDNAGNANAAPSSAGSIQTMTVLDTTAPAISLTGIVSPTFNLKPPFGGIAGTTSSDLPSITIYVYSGSSPVGSPLFTLTTTAASGGAYSVAPTTALSDGSYTVQAVQSDSAGNVGKSNPVTFSVKQIVATQVDDNGTGVYPGQRSMVRSITLTLSSAVTLSQVMSQLSLTRLGGLGAQTLLLSGSLDVTGKILTIKFSGTSVIGGSLEDGRYTLSVGGTTVLNSTQLFRLFGDINGDGQVDSTDQSAFLAAYRSRIGMANYRVYFDFDSNGLIDSSDYYQFLSRNKTRLNADGSISTLP